MGQDSGDIGTRADERTGRAAGQPTRAEEERAAPDAGSPRAVPAAIRDGEPEADAAAVAGPAPEPGTRAEPEPEAEAVPGSEAEPEAAPEAEAEPEAGPGAARADAEHEEQAVDREQRTGPSATDSAAARSSAGAEPAVVLRKAEESEAAAPEVEADAAPEAEPLTRQEAESEPEAEPESAAVAKGGDEAAAPGKRVTSEAETGTEVESAADADEPGAAPDAAGRAASVPEPGPASGQKPAVAKGAAKAGAEGDDEAAARRRAGEIAGMSTPPPGRLLSGRYRLISIVGRGGMGTVWEATDEILGRQVAVKELRLTNGIDDSERKRLITRTLREAKAIATVRSQGVVTIYDVVDEGSRPWIVMELIEGRSLADLIRDDGPMPPARAAEIGLAILDVLRAAHDKGILHRDVKPSNVLIADEDGRIVLTDFGIAKVEGDPSITSTGMLVGAPSYISPERARGEALGPAADLWSLGALLYCCVEGRPPYDEGGAIATLSAVMNAPLRPPRNSSGPLTEAITGLLAKSPKQRLDEPGTRALLTAALTADPDGSEDRTMVVGLRTAGAAPADAPAAPAPQRTPPYGAPALGSGPAGGGKRGLIVAAVLIAVLAVIGTTLLVTRGGGDEADGGQQDQEQGQDPGGSEQPGDDGAAGDADADAGAGTDPGADAADGGADPGTDPGGDAGTDPAQPPAGETDSGESSGVPGTRPENDGDGTLPENPQGYAELTDETFRFRMSLPDGWRRTGIAGQNSGGIFSAPDGGPPKVQVDFNATPGDDAAGAWHSLEPAVRSNSTEYQRIGIAAVGWRDYPTVADWEFERTEGGTRVRVLNRGFQVDPGRGYAIMITCAADAWDEEECRTLRDTAFRTFSPLP
ncbi:Protein kinase domain-containing protein [Streptomyces harbinensis]|uniref:non-specific serine/threonine protein kinase n=1 Tax=Streptomyces harbinensis TaxID=1176198 RepID=A0A1I6NU96_9ACTN|nr:Protein kinase domain-containing protein [Streptomyces harbinensis]